MASAVGNGTKGVPTGCTDVIGMTAEVVARRTGASVATCTIVLIPDSCSKSVREVKVTLENSELYWRK